MPVTTVNRWGVKRQSVVELSRGRLQYSRRVVEPADLLGFQYDEANATTLYLHLSGRGRGKKLMCRDAADRETLAHWLAAWKRGLDPDYFLPMALGDSASEGHGDRTLTTNGGGSTLGSTGPSPGLPARAPSGRSGQVVLAHAGARNGAGDGTRSPRLQELVIQG